MTIHWVAAALVCMIASHGVRAEATPGTPDNDQTLITSLDVAGNVIAVTGGHWCGNNQIICPYVPLVGAHSLKVSVGKQSCQVTRILPDTKECLLARLTLAPDGSRPPKAGLGEPVELHLGDWLHSGGKQATEPADARARVVSWFPTCTADLANIVEDGNSLPMGATLFTEHDGFAGMVVDWPDPEPGAEPMRFLAPAALLNRFAADASEGVSASDWFDSHGGSQNAIVVRLLADPKDAEAVAATVRGRLAEDGAWGRNLDPAALYFLSKRLAPATKGWELVDRLCRDRAGDGTMSGRLPLIAAYGRAVSTGDSSELRKLVEDIGSTTPEGAWLHSWANALLGAILAGHGDKEGEQRLSEVAASWRRCPEPLSALLSYDLAQKDIDKYVAVAKQREALDWRLYASLKPHRQCLLWGRPELARQFLDTAIGRWPGNKAVLVSQGLQYRGEGRFEESARVLRDVLSRDKRDANAWWALWETIEANGDEAGIIAFAREWQAQQNQEMAFAAPAAWFAHRRKFEQALEIMEPGSVKFRTSPAFECVYVNLLEWVGKHDEAWRLSQEAVAINPKDSGVLMAAVTIAVRQERWRECVNLCDQFLGVEREDEDALAIKAKAHRELKEMDEARATLERLERISPSRAAEIRREWASGR